MKNTREAAISKFVSSGNGLGMRPTELIHAGCQFECAEIAEHLEAMANAEKGSARRIELLRSLAAEILSRNKPCPSN